MENVGGSELGWVKRCMASVWQRYGKVWQSMAVEGNWRQLKAVVLAAAFLVWWSDVADYEDSMSVVISWRKFKWRDERGWEVRSAACGQFVQRPSSGRLLGCEDLWTNTIQVDALNLVLSKFQIRDSISIETHKHLILKMGSKWSLIEFILPHDMFYSLVLYLETHFTSWEK